MEPTSVALTSIALLSALLLYKNPWKKTPAPFPPGPKGLPLIGNLRDMPQARTYQTFEEWAKKYGKIVHINVLGIHIIILNDIKYAYEMLESKGRLYSNRPTLVMAGELVGWDKSPPLIQADETWGEYRRLMAGFMGTRAKVEKFEGVMQEEVKELLTRLMSSPQDYAGHFENYAASTVLMLTYGYKSKPNDDPLVKIVNDAMHGFSETTESGTFAVDIFPFLRYVPNWLPGMGWKAKAAIYREAAETMVRLPYEWTKEQMRLGTARSCFLTTALEGEELTAQKETNVQWSAAGIYSGGAHTTAAALSFFLLAAVRHTPELRRAQAEIDAYVGQDRLPSLADRSHLPYFEAFCMEVDRLYPISQLGLQHVPRADDIHDGHFIPKGSIVITNNRLFYRDESLYPKPYEFSPDRFLEVDADGRRKQHDPRGVSFGFGRRSCPGVHLANAMEWLASAALITLFDIRPVEKDGKPVIPRENFQDGIISFPEPFDFVITPRSKLSKDLVNFS